MAEIRVEPKRRSLAWLWVLLALALVAAVAWYLSNDGVNQVDVQTAPTSSSAPATSELIPVSSAVIALPGTTTRA